MSGGCNVKENDNNYTEFEKSEVLSAKIFKSRTYAKTRNLSNQNPNPALKTKTGDN